MLLKKRLIDKPQKTVDHLIAKGLKAGTKDNISVIVIFLRWNVDFSAEVADVDLILHNDTVNASSS